MRQHPATEWREDGVLLGYVSGPFSQAVLPRIQNNNPAKVVDENLIDPISDAEILDYIEYDSEIFSQLVAQRSQGETPEALAKYDPFSRERYSHPMLAKALTEATGDHRTLAKSVIHGHESAHFSISNQFPHLYADSELKSYVLTCEMAFGFEPENYGPFVADINSSLNYSTLAQEAIALEAQAEYLSYNLDPESGAEFRDHYISGARDWLFEPNLPGSKVGSLEHKGALWAYNVINELWDIPIREVMFRVVTEDSNLNPDAVLLSSLCADRDEVANADRAAQWDIFLEVIEEQLNVKNISIAGGTSEYLPWYGTNLDQTEVHNSEIRLTKGLDKYFSSSKHEIIKKNGYRSHWVPLLVDSYPGFNSRKTLLDVLQGLYVTRVGNSRQLLVDPETYQWAAGTKLFDLALDIFYMRERLLTPVIANSPPIHVQPGYLEKRLRAAYIDDEYVSSRTYVKQNKERIINLLTDMQSRIDQDYSDQWRSTIRELRTLGTAILDNDKSKIRRYLS